MANRFWVGGTGTWDSASTAFWAATSGGAGGQTVPGTGDVAIFDGSSGGGTVTVDSPNGAGVVTVQTITMGAFTGTLDFATNNNNVTLSVAFSGTGSGTRTLNMGSGTWTLTGNASIIFDLTTMTNLTLSAASVTLVCNLTATTSRNIIFGAAASIGTITIGANTSGGDVVIQAGASSTLTIGTLNISPPNVVTIAGSGSRVYAITNGFNFSGTSSSPIGFGANTGTTIPTLTTANAMTANWCSLNRLTLAGGGSLTATNSFDLGGITISGGGTKSITPPSSSGHVVGG